MSDVTKPVSPESQADVNAKAIAAQARSNQGVAPTKAGAVPALPPAEAGDPGFVKTKAQAAPKGNSPEGFIGDLFNKKIDVQPSATPGTEPTVMGTEGAPVVKPGEVIPPAAEPKATVPVEKVTVSPVVSTASVDDSIGIPDGVIGTPPVAANAEEIEAPPETKNDPKAKHAWTQTKAQLKEKDVVIGERDARIVELESQVNAGGSAPNERVTELETRVTEYENKIGQLDLAQSPAFVEKYDAKAQGILTKGTQLLAIAGVETDEAVHIMNKLSKADGAAFTSAVEDYTPGVQAALMNLSIDYKGVLAERKTALTEWKQTSAVVKARESQLRAAKTHKEVQSAAAKAIETVAAAGDWAYKKVEGNEAWNKNVDTLTQQVIGLATGGNDEEILAAIAKGVSADGLREAFIKTRTLALQYKAELDKREGVAPHLGGGNAAPAAPAPAAPGTAAPHVRGKPISPEGFVSTLFKTPRAQ